MDNQFNPGQRIFDRSGRAGQFLIRLRTDAFIVLPLFAHEGGEIVGQAEQWDYAFASAPVAIYDGEMSRKASEIAEAEGRLKALKVELKEVFERKVAAERSAEALVKSANGVLLAAQAFVDSVAKSQSSG